MSCPDQEVLIALSDGELGESRARAVRAHIDECTRCRGELAQLGTLAADLRARMRGALRGRSAEAFADDVLASLERPRTKATRFPTWLGLLAAAAMLPLTIGLAHRSLRTTPNVDEWAARGAVMSAEATKRTLVQFGRVSGTTFEPLSEGSRLEADALIAAEVGGTEGPPRYLLAFLVDAEGERHWIYPAYEPGAPPPDAIALPATAPPRVLSSMVRLDRPASGPGRLVAIVLPRTESVEHVEHAPLEQLGREELSNHYGGALVVVIRVEVQ
ncbi:MAG: hypothetical protein K0S65_3130 [Labilithrix sp.]|nr:hypothetical protein [Labilithrix sp.]